MVETIGTKRIIILTLTEDYSDSDIIGMKSLNPPT